LNNINYLSFDRFHFDDENWWAPTLDLLNFKGSPTTPSKKLLLIEEYTHRQVFIPTEVWLWASWIEALSNCEVLYLLNEIREAQIKDTNFKFYAPLKFNLTRASFPSELKLRIRDISRACKNIHLHIKSCEPIVEAIILCLIRKWSKGDEKTFDKFRAKKVEIYGNLETAYPIVEKIFKKIDSKILVLVTGCLFSLGLRSDYPSFSLSDSFKIFNDESALNIQEKTEKFSDRIKNKILTRDAFLEFIGKNDFVFSEMHQLNENVQNSMAVIPDLIEINGYQKISKWIDRLVTTSGYPFVNLLMTESKIRKGEELYNGNVQHRFMLRGKATMRIEAEKECNIIFRKEMPDFICKSMTSALEATLLKYSLLDGESIPIGLSRKEDSLIHNFLKDVKLKKVKTQSHRT
jgi:hypothetical protein